MRNNLQTNNAPMCDSFGRPIEYLRLSVTDRCDLRCSYCMPKGFSNYEEPSDWLNQEEAVRVVRIFTELGVQRVRLTGGEPLTRRNLPQLAQQLGALPRLKDLSLSTNATRLTQHASTLFAAGIRRINVSLDSLRPTRFQEITGGGKLKKVIDGLMAAKEAGFAPIKINMVAMRGVNDDEFGDMVDFCITHGFTLRFIETMPVGDTGNRIMQDHFLDLREVRAQLEQRFDLIPSLMPGGGPARYFKVRGTDLHFGFITPLSQHFCDTCNRVRLSVDGTLYLCLGQEDKVELRPLLRNGVSDAELRETIVAAIACKPKRHEFNKGGTQVVRFMSMTGG
jgi:cyclic pyranopterin phosphate synthase